MNMEQCELHDHTSKSLLINWKQGSIQGSAVITVSKNRTSFVDLGRFFNSAESS